MNISTECNVADDDYSSITTSSELCCATETASQFDASLDRHPEILMSTPIRIDDTTLSMQATSLEAKSKLYKLLKRLLLVVLILLLVLVGWADISFIHGIAHADDEQRQVIDYVLRAVVNDTLED